MACQGGGWHGGSSFDCVRESEGVGDDDDGWSVMVGWNLEVWRSAVMGCADCNLRIRFSVLSWVLILEDGLK